MFSELKEQDFVQRPLGISLLMTIVRQLLMFYKFLNGKVRHLTNMMVDCHIVGLEKEELRISTVTAIKDLKEMIQH